jgi:hypothetical protein
VLSRFYLQHDCKGFLRSAEDVPALGHRAGQFGQSGRPQGHGGRADALFTGTAQVRVSRYGRSVSRYRALLDVSSAMVEQPTVKAVLHSLRDVLSSSCRLHGVDIYVLGSSGDTLHLLDFDREAHAPAIKSGTKISLIGAVARVLAEREPVFLPNVAQEMSRHPELAPFAAESVGRASYVFPLFTSQQHPSIVSCNFNRGDRLILYTDGLVEVFNSLDDMLGVEGLEALILESAQRPIRELKQAILNGVTAWRHGPLSDDVSLVIVDKQF